MKVTSLSSGSSGNCYLVQSKTTNILIDSGLTASAIEKHLAERGLSMTDLSAVFLTHDHSDHLKSAGTISRKWGIPIVANERTLKISRYKWDKISRMEAIKLADENLFTIKPRYNLEILPAGGVKSVGDIEVCSIPVSHDAAETVCYTVRADNCQATILTDLGCATEPIFEPLYNSDLIILEANYDLERLKTNRGYPAMLKNRILSDHGHLSNFQSAAILKQVLEYSGINRVVWLAHLSKDNNDPANATKTISTALENAGIKRFPLKVALRDKPSLSWQPQDQFFQAQMSFAF